MATTLSARHSEWCAVRGRLSSSRNRAQTVSEPDSDSCEGIIRTWLRPPAPSPFLLTESGGGLVPFGAWPHLHVTRVGPRPQRAHR